MKSTFAIILAVLALMLASPTPRAGLGIDQRKAALRQGSNSLAVFAGFVTNANFELLGFGSVGEASSATNAEPLLIYTVPLSRLKTFELTNDFTALLDPDPRTDPAPVNRVIIPVMAGPDVRSSISLRLVTLIPEPRWTNANWGRPNLIKALVAAAQAIPPNLVAFRGGPFVVEIPVFDVWFIGYLNNDNPPKLILVSTADMQFGSSVIQRHQVVTPAAMYQMRLAAQRYNGLAN